MSYKIHEFWAFLNLDISGTPHLYQLSFGIYINDENFNDC